MTEMRVLQEDLDLILEHCSSIWEDFRGARIFITGGTGFFGCWLLEALTYADEKLTLGLQVVVLSREPKAFQKKAPHLARHQAVRLIAGDVRGFAFPEGRFTHVIHAATEASATMNLEQPLTMLDTIVQGTRRTLDFAIHAGATKFLLTSSGAVYGRQAPNLTNVPETYLGAPDPSEPSSAYGEGKRVAELLCAIYHKLHGLDVKIARCFAFVGHYLPLDGGFAVGNFIRDASAGDPIRLNSDGTPQRSYLYAADLVVWLLTILASGKPSRAYNVGSGEAITLRSLAEVVNKSLNSSAGVVVAPASPTNEIDRYVPEVSRAQQELNLHPCIPLSAAVWRTARSVCRSRSTQLIVTEVETL